MRILFKILAFAAVLSVGSIVQAGHCGNLGCGSCGDGPIRRMHHNRVEAREERQGGNEACGCSQGGGSCSACAGGTCAAPAANVGKLPPAPPPAPQK